MKTRSLSLLLPLLGLLVVLMHPTIGYGEDAPESPDARIKGTVSYQERMALPPKATLRLLLVDAAAPGAGSFLIAELPIAKIPKPFDISYDPDLLDARRNYRIKGQISVQGNVLFEGGERPLKEAKVIQSHDVGALVLKKVKEPSHPHESHLKGHTWVLVEIPSADVTKLKGSPPRIIFSKHDTSVSGFTGCNRFWGEYELNGETLQLKPPATTRMACVEIMAFESLFLDMLQQVARFKLLSDELVFEDANGKVLARFKRDTLTLG